MQDLLLSSKRMVLLIAISAAMLGGCAPKANVNKAHVEDADASASYIWHINYIRMRGLEREDAALLMSIKGDNLELNNIYKESDYDTHSTALLPGEYQLTITFAEAGLCLLFIECMIPQEYLQVLLIVKEDRIYMPFVDDECERNWVWIEDWGSARELLDSMLEMGRAHWNTYIDTFAVVVAGEKPPDEC